MNNYIELKKYFMNILTQEKTEIEFENFIRFLVDNDWFQMNTKLNDEKTKVYIPVMELSQIEDRILLFVRNHNKSFDEKKELLYNMLLSKFPDTHKHLCDFGEKVSVFDNIKYQLLEFILSYVDKELYLYSDKEMTGLFQILCEEMNLNVSQCFADFLDYLSETRLTVFSLKYVPNKRYQGQNTTEAYDSDTYLQLIYNLFCEDAIVENELYSKIAKNAAAANILLYLSLHMICALRDTDLVKLPHPKLIEDPEEILEKIENETLSDKTALTAVNYVLFHLKVFDPVPNKTEKYSNISGIKLIIPESAMKHFGILFCASEAHFRLGHFKRENYIHPVKDYYSISRHLGENIGEIFWEKDFSSLSSNKTFLQIIESFGDHLADSEDKTKGMTKGYMLAALARSHKGAYGEFASTTAIYLKDAKFSGYSVEFIAKELFERGVCSFIPSMLLKILLGKNYSTLPIHKQTKAIATLGMTPFETENLVITIDKSMREAIEIVNKICTQTAESRTLSIQGILHSIACGNAVSKSYSCMCLLSAMDKICAYPERQQCIGCKYEISTKSTTFVLANEFKRLKELKENSSSNVLADKYTDLLKQTVLPALSELFYCISKEYGEESVRELEEIITEVV